MPSRAWQIVFDAVAGRSDGSTALDALCVACAQALPVSGVGLALMTQTGHEGTVTATDGPAAVMESLQDSLGEGPCVDAFQRGRPVLEPDLAAAGIARWPVFGPEAFKAGIAAIFAFPLQVGAIRVGVLDLYRDTAGSLTEQELAEALAFADAATMVLLHVYENASPERSLDPQLTGAIASRREIHQATGMVSVQAMVSLADALLLLRAHAYASERSLLETAQDVVARRLHIGPEDDHHD